MQCCNQQDAASGAGSGSPGQQPCASIVLDGAASKRHVREHSALSLIHQKAFRCFMPSLICLRLRTHLTPFGCNASLATCPVTGRSASMECLAAPDRSSHLHVPLGLMLRYEGETFQLSASQPVRAVLHELHLRYSSSAMKPSLVDLIGLLQALLQAFKRLEGLERDMLHGAWSTRRCLVGQKH